MANEVTTRDGRAIAPVAMRRKHESRGRATRTPTLVADVAVMKAVRLVAPELIELAQEAQERLNAGDFAAGMRGLRRLCAIVNESGASEPSLPSHVRRVLATKARALRNKM